MAVAEPGWPLIPREVLPAPVELAHPRKRRTATPTVPGGKQLSVFGVEASDPSLADLAGLLAGPGTLGKMGGTARVSVRVDAAWRVHVMVQELVGRGLVVNWNPISENPREEPVAELTSVPVDEEHDDSPTPEPERVDKEVHEVEPTVAFEVRTAYSSRLNGLAHAWPPPAGKLFLNGPRLRLWVAAAGAPRLHGYALGLDPDGSLDKAVDAALTRVGLAGTVHAGRTYVIAGRRRLARLAELVGERPEAAPERLWPGGAAA
ncbi:hypothetical protein [Winogradskya humida]|uniref:Uncharacterized protein n=1 Tax=Winogradskya humida TaxID=113566 RepID=A0ABQ3ZMB0_9ACTN|nr:hypothetical protein [Actinoplanes humidus]GIE19662.1 hypothetical protein Ahu01nite_027640 [Actinoplanes humidus]